MSLCIGNRLSLYVSSYGEYPFIGFYLTFCTTLSVDKMSSIQFNLRTYTYVCMYNYLCNNLQDLLNLDSDSHFEECFFVFRSKVKNLEGQMVGSLVSVFAGAPSLPAQLRVLELFKGVARRDNIKVCTVGVNNTRKRVALWRVVARVYAGID